MESSQSSPRLIQGLVGEIKGEILSASSFDNLHSSVSPSAYDTAWVAIVPDPKRPSCSAFGDCLDWVIDNQREEGFWGEVDGHGQPTIDALPSTLACMLALKTWNVGDEQIAKGLAFINASSEKLLKEKYNNFPRSFSIVFPAMLERVQKIGLKIVFSGELEGIVTNIFYSRQLIFDREKLVDKYHYPPLISYLEALPSTYNAGKEEILDHVSEDGSLFQSPSATAAAFMATGNETCINYLQSLLQRCTKGVPAMFPVDGELIKLCMVNQLQRLGLACHFVEEIEQVLKQAYRNYMIESTGPSLNPAQLYKDSLAFRLLRMHGYSVSPWRFCRFLLEDDMMAHIEKNSESFSSVMFNVYRATDLMFTGEYELEEARSFSMKLLEKSLSSMNNSHHDLVMLPNFRLIEHDLSVPWMARLDHLDHRIWIEENEVHTLWTGKASFYRLFCLHNEKLMQLAIENYCFRQSIYRSELEELKRWSKEWGLTEMGFGREKTLYCYFAVAASSSSLPMNYDVRMIVAKSAIIITVADDFFDTEGSHNELIALTRAIRRWDGNGLSGHGKIIFAILDHLVSNIAVRHLTQHGDDITKNLQDMWYETFHSWLIETTRSCCGHIPTIDEYLETGMTSIAVHTMVLPASCFLRPRLPNDKLKPAQYESITRFLMVITRLLNDMQSYQKEEEDGKINPVLIYLKENPEADIEDSIGYIKEIVDEKKKEFLEHVLMDGLSDLPKPCKHFHLSCLKVFQMFFNSSNKYDSKTQMIPDIQKAIYLPLGVQTSQLPLHKTSSLRKIVVTSAACGAIKRYRNGRGFAIHTAPWVAPRHVSRKMFFPSGIRLRPA
ncbi:(E,E)-geranyllinalool synthase-like [Malania oleifera]|uniref:(E,E)-geranyllinalool synthase-like n=1 Tax=Malania oleifera TaxID=397392 RepID=UPI0025AE9222|nr:(E,E)-geranyllinalool synthase-like [Malania oleifera]